jgi:hypothetical protein
MHTTASDELIDFKRSHGLASGMDASVRLRGRDGCDEVIARPRDGLDLRRRPDVVTKRLPHVGDMYRQDALFNEGIRPDAREQFVLCEQSSRLLNRHHHCATPRFWQRLGRNIVLCSCGLSRKPRPHAILDSP